MLKKVGIVSFYILDGIEVVPRPEKLIA